MQQYNLCCSTGVTYLSLLFLQLFVAKRWCRSRCCCEVPWVLQHAVAVQCLAAACWAAAVCYICACLIMSRHPRALAHLSLPACKWSCDHVTPLPQSSTMGLSSLPCAASTPCREPTNHCYCRRGIVCALYGCVCSLGVSAPLLTGAPMFFVCGVLACSFSRQIWVNCLELPPPCMDPFSWIIFGRDRVPAAGLMLSDVIF